MIKDADQRFNDFVLDGTGFAPYKWQIYVATKGLPSILPVPTGLGKTEGAVLAWAWRRFVAQEEEPQHLVYCLPMRTLVRQTVERLRNYFEALREKRGIEIRVYELMGGTPDEEWARWPDKPWVLVGTQDQLLSRALNRGYAMNRFEWAMHFGLLNQNCRWIIDEVQLMGPGLWTTSQLDWMRQKRFFTIKKCATTWMSATVGVGFLATVDRRNDGLDTAEDKQFLEALSKAITQDQNQEAQNRLGACRPVNWFKAKKNVFLPEQIANNITDRHACGTLSLVVCNTVDTARDIFEKISSDNKILLTSRFRRQDREQHERRLLDFESCRREEYGKPIPNDPGLICVSTQVVEAGLDISAHQLWSELAPWPSVIQRLGRLNRDGLDQDVQAWFWETPKKTRGKKERTGPYETSDITLAKKLFSGLVPLSKDHPFVQALEELEQGHKKDLEEALRPKLTPLPRALDVHGLFSTERDVHGGFTDVSPFVRSPDPDADLTVFWREWSSSSPPRGDDLDGPDLDIHAEGCPIAFFRLQEILKTPRAKAWIWDDEEGQWESIRSDDLRPGMTVMLHRDVGGYRADVGWTGNKEDRLGEAQRAGRGRGLRDDARTETGYWATLNTHLVDARFQAEKLCDAIGLDGDFRAAVVEAAALHDLGKAHPQWQQALPGGDVLTGGPWAKCPRILAVDVASHSDDVRNAVHTLRLGAYALADEARKRGSEQVVRLRWAVSEKIKREELEALKKTDGVRWAGYVPFRPGLRHEAASALAMWKRYRECAEGNKPYPALAVYLAATHHGKVRTVLRATTNDGNDVFGVPTNPDTLDFDTTKWPLDFSIAKDGAGGQWQKDHFLLTDHGWTGLVADLLGPWQDNDTTDVGVVPENEPRKLGPFALAYLEALVRVADWRASDKPTKSLRPEEVSSND